MIDKALAAKRARDQRESRERLMRLEITRGREYVLADIDPPLLRDDLTGAEVSDYFNVSRSTVIGTARRHRTEMLEVGYQPGNRAVFTRRAVLHVALLFHHQTSAKANEVAAALGVDRVPIIKPGPDAPSERRVRECRTLLRHAGEIAEAVQQESPQLLWEDLNALDDHTLRSLVVTLGALVPLDRPNIRQWLSDMGARLVEDQGTADASAIGLTLLIPDAKQMPMSA